MNWDQAPGLVVSSISAGAVITGVALSVRAVIRSGAEGSGVLKQQVETLESRMKSMEADVRDLTRGQMLIQVQLAAIPEQLKGIERVITLQHDAAKHSAANLKMSVESLARRVGIMSQPDG